MQVVISISCRWARVKARDRAHMKFSKIGEATKRTALDSLPDLTAPAKAPKTERSNRS